MPDLLYVAISRVKDADHLQVLNFKPELLLKPQQKVVDCCSAHHCDGESDLSCCRRRVVEDDTLFCVDDRFSSQEADHEGDEGFSFPLEMFDGPIQVCFEEDGVQVAMELSQLYDHFARHASDLSVPPSMFLLAAGDLLSSMKKESVLSSFAEEKNKVIESLRSNPQLETFINIVWHHSFRIIEHHIIGESADEIVVSIGRQDFTEATRNLDDLFNSQEFTQYICGLFATTRISPVQNAVAVQLAESVYFGFFQHLSEHVLTQQQEEQVTFNVEDMSEVVKSKLRYVGGWAVKKVLEGSRRFVRQNIYTRNTETLRSVQEHLKKCELIDENLIVPYSMLEESTTHAESPEVTEERQFQRRGLVHISDATYEFLLCLEGHRVQLLNDAKLKREKEMMVERAYDSLMQNKDLRDKWETCFSNEVAGTDVKVWPHAAYNA